MTAPRDRLAVDLGSTGTAWSSPLPPGPALVGDRRADVLVVGAGIAGLATATALAEAGAEVLVIARHPVGEGVSGRSTAKVTALHQLVYADLASRHGTAAAAAYATASQDAVDWVRDHAGDAAEPRDAVTVARSEAEAADLVRERDAAQAAGLPVVLDDHVPGWPGAVRSGLRLPGQVQVEPVALLRRLAEALPTPVHTGVLTGVREWPGGARAAGRSPDGSFTVRADHVVLATGLPVLDRGAFFALAEPQASYLVAFRQEPGAVGPGESMMIAAGSPTRSLRWARPDAGDPIVLVGGEGHRPGTGGPTTPRYETLVSWARQHLPGLGEEVARWSAEDFMSPDRLPFAGPHLRLPGPVQVITGLSKWGYALGVASAQVVACRILGQDVGDFGRLVHPARIPDAPGIGTVARAQVEVGSQMAQGWLGGALRRADREPAEGRGSVGRCGVLPCASSTVDGTSRTVSAICTHLGGVVRWNDGDRTWDCPLHGSRFEPDGTVRHGPAIAALDQR